MAVKGLFVWPIDSQGHLDHGQERHKGGQTERKRYKTLGNQTLSQSLSARPSLQVVKVKSGQTAPSELTIGAINTLFFHETVLSNIYNVFRPGYGTRN